MTQAERGHIAYKKETTWGTVAAPATKVWTMNNEAIIQNAPMVGAVCRHSPDE